MVALVLAWRSTFSIKSSADQPGTSHSGPQSGSSHFWSRSQSLIESAQ